MESRLRPRILGNIRNMLAEKDQDITRLRARLRASEELKGEPLSRLEQLEARIDMKSLGSGRDSNSQLEFSNDSMDCYNAEGLRTQAFHINLLKRLEVLEKAFCTRNGMSKTFHAHDLEKRVQALEQNCEQLFAPQAQEQLSKNNDDAQDHLREMQQFADQLQEQLSMSNARHAALTAEAKNWQAKAEDAQREVLSLRQRVQEFERAQATSVLDGREVEALRARLAHTVEQASMLGSQLAARDADVARLQRRLSFSEAASHEIGNTSDLFPTATSVAGSVASSGPSPRDQHLRAPIGTSMSGACGSPAVGFQRISMSRPEPQRIVSSRSAADLSCSSETVLSPTHRTGLGYPHSGNMQPGSAGDILLQQRSQSVPVQLQRMASAPPAAGAWPTSPAGPALLQAAQSYQHSHFLVQPQLQQRSVSPHPQVMFIGHPTTHTVRR
eukprot:TRINITY_DN74529_c0_g1_i1.p1 TRINITY_DN74529_c0_g1~~TRINITY_DN74529_c0_g1_i1.p1  ORF type:complete len:450 (-),score=72.19 TRINITY_DN74529_c0_g1_i1:12-1337(-)